MNSFIKIVKILGALLVGLGLTSAFAVASVETVTLAVPTLVLFALALLFFVLPSIRENVRLPVHYLLILLSAGFFVGRALLSPIDELAFLDLVLILSALCLYVALYFARGSQQAMTIIWSFLGLIFVTNIGLGIAQKWGGLDWTVLSLLDIGRVSGTRVPTGFFPHHNYFGSVLAMMVPFFSLGVLRAKTHWSLRTLFALGAIICVAFVKMSLSRGSIAALFVGMLFLCIFVVARLTFNGRGAISRAKVIGLIFVGLVALGVGGYSASLVFKERAHSQEGVESLFDSDFRLEMMVMAIEQFQTAPIFGTGSRTYSYLCYQHWPSDLGSRPAEPVLAHNDHLQILAEYGIMGFLLLFITASWHIVSALRRLFQKEKGGEWVSREAWIVGACSCGLIACLTHMLVDFNLHILPVCLMATAFLAFLAPSPVEKKGSQNWLKTINLVIVSCVVIFCLSFGRSQWRSGWPLMAEGMRMETGYWTPSINFIRPEWPDLLEASLKEEPHFERYKRLGYCYWMLSKQQKDEKSRRTLMKALDAYKKSRERHPWLFESSVKIATIYDELGELDEAEKEWSRIVPLTECREEWFRNYQKLAETYERQAFRNWQNGNLEEARAYFEKSVEMHYYSDEIEPANGGPRWTIRLSRTLIHQANFLANQNEFQKAFDNFETILYHLVDPVGRESQTHVRVAIAEVTYLYARHIWNQRKPEEALFLMKRALLLIRSYKKDFPNQMRAQVSAIEKNCVEVENFLEKARIQPKRPSFRFF